MLIDKYLQNNLNLNINITDDQKTYLFNAKADAIHCHQSIEKYLDRDKKILEVGGAFIYLPVFYTKIMILLQLNLEVLQASPMNYAIRF